MAKDQPVSGTTQVGTANGNTEGYSKLADLAAALAPLLGGATVSTSAPVSGDGSTGSPITVTDAALATALAGTGACAAIKGCVAGSGAPPAAITAATEVVIKSGGTTYCTTVQDILDLAGGSSGGGSIDPTLGGVGYQISLSGTTGTVPSGPHIMELFFTSTNSGVDGHVYLVPLSGGETWTLSQAASFDVRAQVGPADIQRQVGGGYSNGASAGEVLANDVFANLMSTAGFASSGSSGSGSGSMSDSEEFVAGAASVTGNSTGSGQRAAVRARLYKIVAQ